MKRFTRTTASLCLALTLMSQLHPALAAVIGTGEALTQTSATTAHLRDQLRAALARDEARAWLQTQGVAPEMVESRIAQLTDQEAQQLAAKLESLPAGGDILGTVLFIFVLFVITDALGVTDIFPFVHPYKR